MYRENKNFGFGDLAIGNKGKNDFLISVNTLLDWVSIESDTPDHSTISRVGNSLIKNKLYKKLFLEINRQFESKGILVKNGAIVDATIISSNT